MDQFSGGVGSMKEMMRDFSLFLALGFFAIGVLLIRSGFSNRGTEAATQVLAGGVFSSVGLAASYFSYKMHTSRPQD